MALVYGGTIHCFLSVHIVQEAGLALDTSSKLTMRLADGWAVHLLGIGQGSEGHVLPWWNIKTGLVGLPLLLWTWSLVYHGCSTCTQLLTGTANMFSGNMMVMLWRFLYTGGSIRASHMILLIYKRLWWAKTISTWYATRWPRFRDMDWVVATPTCIYITWHMYSIFCLYLWQLKPCCFEPKDACIRSESDHKVFQTLLHEFSDVFGPPSISPASRIKLKIDLWENKPLLKQWAYNIS